MAGKPKRRERLARVAAGDPTLTRDCTVPRKTFPVTRHPTDEEIDRAISFTRLGSPLETAMAAAASVDRRTFRAWLHRADEPGPEQARYVRLRDGLEQARAEAVINGLALIQAGARPGDVVTTTETPDGKTIATRHERGDWRAAAWVLERTNPQHFAQRVQVRVEEEIAAVLDALESELDGDTYATVLGIIVRRLGGGEATDEGDTIDDG